MNGTASGDGVVTATVKVNGTAIDPAWELLSIDVRREVNRIPTASLELLDGDAATGTFALSEHASLDLGHELEIKLRYEGDPANEKTVFKGLINRQRIEADGSSSRLVVEAKDKALAMTQGRQTTVFVKMSDADVLKRLVQKAGLKAGKIDPTEPKHEQLTQFYCTDWDFMVTRAETAGLLIVVEDGQVSAIAPPLGGQPRYKLEHGMSFIYDFAFEGDGTRQLAGVTTRSWVAKDMQAKSANANVAAPRLGNWKHQSVAKQLGFPPTVLAQPIDLPAAEVAAWGKARLLRRRLALVRGRVSMQGVADLRLLDCLDLKGFGKRFNGSGMVTGLSHRVAEGTWRTDVQFGLAPEGTVAIDALADAPAAGTIPPVSGLQVGIVRGFEEDPGKALRLKVALPAFGDTVEIWARLAAPDAGKDRGFFFRPEPGDEVIVGFLNDDPRAPVVLGSVFGAKNAQPKLFGAPAKANEKKGLVTRSGMAISFVDAEKPQLWIETPAKNKVWLDDDQKCITVSDQHGNTVTLNDKGITLKSAKDLIIDSKGDVKITASGNVAIQGAKVDVK